MSIDEIQKINKEYYEQNAERWAEIKTHSFYSEKEFRVFVEHCEGEGAKILDIGCGYGRDVPLFLGIGRKLKYEGVDISIKFIEIAQSRYPQLTFYQGNILSEGELKENYGGFWAAATLQHIPEEDWDLMMKNIESAMVGGAVGYFSIPEDRPNPASEDDPRHFALLGEKRVAELLFSRGWQMLEHGELPATRGTTVWRWYIVKLPE